MSDDLVSRLRAPSFTVPAELSAQDKLMALIRGLEALCAESATEIERLREQVFELEHGVEDQMEEAAYHAKQRAAAESELSTLRGMLVLCGELGGMGKDETPAAYLRRLIDEVASVESLRARVREVVWPFTRYRVRMISSDSVADYSVHVESSTENQPQFKHYAAARQLMEEVKNV